MRILLAFVTSATPALAWEFTPGLPCVLDHQGAEAEVQLTYDPRLPLYSIAITRSDPWPADGTFSITYLGNQTFRIATDRQILSNGGRTLTVSDAGFGNVLNGLQFGDTAIAAVNGSEVAIDLRNAAGPTEAFRACEVPLA